MLFSGGPSIHFIVGHAGPKLPIKVTPAIAYTHGGVSIHFIVLPGGAVPPTTSPYFHSL